MMECRVRLGSHAINVKAIRAESCLFVDVMIPEAYVAHMPNPRKGGGDDHDGTAVVPWAGPFVCASHFGAGYGAVAVNPANPHRPIRMPAILAAC